MALETLVYKGYTINIDNDDFGSPREEYDNLGVIYSNCQSFNPDKHTILELVTEEDGNQFPFKRLSKDYYYGKLWVYEHGGITIKMSNGNPFCDAWDSGFAGVIVMSKEKAKKEWGYKKCCKALEEKVLKCLQAEIKILDDYLVYGSMCYTIEKDGDLIESCGGYITDNIEEVINEAKSIVDAICNS